MIGLKMHFSSAKPLTFLRKMGENKSLHAVSKIVRTREICDACQPG
jgi:hypothetical protein